RTIGRPDELRAQLFQRSLVVETIAPLGSPDAVFGAIESVGNWQPDGTARYILSVADPRAAAPAVTRALVAAGADVASIAESRHSLEDVYLELVKDDGEVESR
ncbi:MAG: DUF4162 domain-containing protein, partial [Thermoleophilia bacterium]